MKRNKFWKKKYKDNAMGTIEHYLWCIEDTKEYTEFPSIYESTLYRSTLHAIASSDHKGYSAKELAKKALLAEDIDFERGFCRSKVSDLLSIWWGTGLCRVERVLVKMVAYIPRKYRGRVERKLKKIIIKLSGLLP